MKADNFNLQTYLQRIGFDGVPHDDLQTLTALMRRQLFSVPFENLDVQAGKAISMAPEAIVEKIVERGRGGYCYEVNGLFAMALEALGVDYQFVACRPMTYPVLRPRTHMALAVELEGESWLCDLGFGSYGIRAPLRLADSGTEVRQGSDTFLLERPNEREYVLKARVDGEWANQYGFDLWPQQWIDFVPANYLNCTHPEALFVQKLVVVLHAPDGRSILVGNQFKRVRGGEVETRTIPDEEIGGLLRNAFGLSVDDEGLFVGISKTPSFVVPAPAGTQSNQSTGSPPARG
ncbi:MAG TPA: arylamine N-acetyltransferase [Gammaproteobacteria bacterium]|jgi:N-hydroxyarylamine O-acetyltransferase